MARQRSEPSWYLDKLTAAQKREAHVGLVRRWAACLTVERVLKTDLFEEAFGEDQILPGMFPGARLVCGMDAAAGTAGAAARRFAELAGRVAAMDVSCCGLKRAAFDLVISTSTLDHFARREEFLRALAELSSAVRPGGLLILTLDNPLNPLYHPLRWMSWAGLAPFRLGYTPSMGALRADLRDAGFEVEAEDWLIHNPRLISTALFLAWRMLAGRRADAGIAALLRVFDSLRRLPTRRWTACFQAVAARRRI